MENKMNQEPWTPQNNRIQWKHLTPEESKSFGDFGDHWLPWYSDDTHWHRGGSGQPSGTCIYRLPAATPLRVHWPSLPAGVVAVARDESGQVSAHWINPMEGAICWFSSVRSCRIDDFPGLVLDPGTCDWRDSLVLRPKGGVE